MPYTSREAVRNVSGLTETEISDAVVDEMINLADRDIELITEKVWTGQQIKELLGIQKSSRNRTFRTIYKPVVDEFGNTTDDETKVTVYVDGTQQDSDKFELRGAEGKIVFADAPSIGAEVEMTYRYSLKPVQKASTFLAASYCFRRLAKSEEKEKRFKAEAMEILRELTGHTFGTTK
jgi:hypothetical protein